MVSLPPRALLFDMDGTIVDNMDVHTTTWLELLARHGVQTSPEEFFSRTAGMVSHQIFRIYFGERLSDEEIDRYGAEKEALYRERYAPHVAPVSGLTDLLMAAKASGVKTGLATSAPPENIDFILGRTGLHFDTVVGAADITHGKPHPEIYLRCAERLGVAPEECLVFEDAPMGVEAGVRAGMRTYVITTVLTREEAAALPGIAGVIADFDGLAEALLRC